MARDKQTNKQTNSRWWPEKSKITDKWEHSCCHRRWRSLVHGSLKRWVGMSRHSCRHTEETLPRKSLARYKLWTNCVTATEGGVKTRIYLEKYKWKFLPGICHLMLEYHREKVFPERISHTHTSRLLHSHYCWLRQGRQWGRRLLLLPSLPPPPTSRMRSSLREGREQPHCSSPPPPPPPSSSFFVRPHYPPACLMDVTGCWRCRLHMLGQPSGSGPVVK